MPHPGIYLLQTSGTARAEKTPLERNLILIEDELCRTMLTRTR